MNIFLTLAYLFFIGSTSGWVLELFFRRFLSTSNPERKWINPGFCTGPYLPLYGSGLCILYLIASVEEKNLISNPILNKIVLFIFAAVAMTVLEYITGIINLKYSKIRLWDYSDEWGNIQGIICPRFSAAWAIICALYYFLIHPRILNALEWLANNLAFSFVIGMFFGVFIIDAVNSAQLVVKLKKFAEENDVIVKYENIKAHIRTKQEQALEKYRFFRPFQSNVPIGEHLHELLSSFEHKVIKKNK